MRYRKLGKTNIEISEITFGCWELGGGQWEKQSDEVNIEAIQKAFELGIHTFDTAEGYGKGHSEEVVRTALDGKRKDCIISTKVSPEHLKPEDVRASAEKSLKRLGTDYLDIYYIHWPNKEIQLEQTLSEFNKLKEEGLIRAIGVSNFSIDQLREAVKYAQIDVIQPEYSLLHRGIEKEIVPFCEEHSIGIMSYSSLGKGILTGVYHNGKAQIKDTDFRRQRRLFLPEHLEQEKPLIEALTGLAEAKNVTLGEIAISWLLHQRAMTSAIVGTQNIKHLTQNVKAVEVELTADEQQQLSDISTRVLQGIDG
ncbi:aldo/keto reductase [Ammoniphilus resinae]|uniref:Aryl-alcohol dehydrogenase-like predicted oxidoreductase n=1 Tax=Ammoniphilus resinae TaxID=861532 RepID=A0ABS4GQM1_9BACL|nr:aldo/keto reductase [Ammoniphilus resinae]MBP1932185.1 aryl-alcohol dehydrogenase-like predicted oxidoreductase [Ammoniphilus resinae]